MTRECIALLLGLLLLAGCRTYPEIPASDGQSLVMELTILAAGITAEQLALTTSDIQASASPRLYNERQEPATVHYRFYWYDARGLEMHPLGAPRSVAIPIHSSVTLYGSANFLGAYKVGLYLYLQGVNLDKQNELLRTDCHAGDVSL